MAQSPVPIVCGVGHETDFTIADFVADLRAPTPTAAAELASQSTTLFIDALSGLEQSMRGALERRFGDSAQSVDRLAARLGRPSVWIAKQTSEISGLRSGLQVAIRARHTVTTTVLERLSLDLPRFGKAALGLQKRDLRHLSDKLDALSPQRVLQRGFAWLAQENGQPVTSVGQIAASQDLRATLSDGTVDLRVLQTHHI
jgi:exodeoxyribonuclease VII large subunit